MSVLLEHRLLIVSESVPFSHVLDKALVELEERRLVSDLVDFVRRQRQEFRVRNEQANGALFVILEVVRIGHHLILFYLLEFF